MPLWCIYIARCHNKSSYVGSVTYMMDRAPCGHMSAFLFVIGDSSYAPRIASHLKLMYAGMAEKIFSLVVSPFILLLNSHEP